MRPTTIVHITHTGGHHESYQQLFLRLLPRASASTGAIWGERFWHLVRAERVLFATLDDDVLGFVAVALTRALQGRPTVAIFLRSLQCFSQQKRVLYAAKRYLFTLLRRLPRLKLLTIVPHDLHPELKQVSHDWIHDPQLWDLWLDGPPSLPETTLSQRVAHARRGRKVLLFIGLVNREKGFEAFLSLARELSDTTMPVLAGRLSGDLAEADDAVRALGGLVEDRYLADEELLSLYGVADVVWCEYAPEYDLPSGIFGRAVQLGALARVRPGSLLERIATRYRLPHVTAASDPRRMHEPNDPGARAARVTPLREHSLRVIRAAFEPPTS